MIEDLDASLKAMLAGEAAAGSGLATATISFGAPDPTWQGQGSGLQVDLYLYRVIDNRELRSNQRTTVRNPDGSVTTSVFPARVECSYAITAWEKGSDVAGLEKELTEHALLGQVLTVLWRNPVIPARYLAGSLANAELPPPVIAAESEDMAAKPDFWSALDTYVRPAITCRITLAVDLSNDVSGPQATTISTSLQRSGTPGADGLVQIGGIIRSAALPDQTIPDAWILLDASAVTAVTDATGAFRLANVSAGPHRLTVRAVGFAQGSRAFTVPDPSGSYDVSLTPL
jgi:Pvc16 N-terminal domain/Carboxypeptidase regulatory-like domain